VQIWHYVKCFKLHCLLKLFCGTTLELLLDALQMDWHLMALGWARRNEKAVLVSVPKGGCQRRNLEKQLHLRESITAWFRQASFHLPWILDCTRSTHSTTIWRWHSKSSSAVGPRPQPFRRIFLTMDCQPMRRMMDSFVDAITIMLMYFWMINVMHLWWSIF